MKCTLMAIPSHKLESLEKYSNQLHRRQLPNREEVKGMAVKAIEELYAELENKDLSFEECNRIYEVIHLFADLDLTSNTSRVAWLTKKVYSAIWGTPTDNLITFLNQKRADFTKKLFDEEKSRVTREHQLWIQSFIRSPDPSIDQNSVRKYIIGRRHANPRIILSLQDEIQLLRRLGEQQLSGLQEQLRPGARAREGVENLERILDVLEQPLFTLEDSINAALQKEKHTTGATILKPDAASLKQNSIDQLRMQRLCRLENLEKVYLESLDRPNATVASKAFEPTSAWYVGAFRGSKPFSNFGSEMQQIGQENGIKVISDIRIGYLTSVEITENESTDLMLDCEPILASHNIDALGAFPQDFVDFSRNGEIRIPAMKQPKVKIELDEHLKKNRIVRSPEWKDVMDSLGDQAPVQYLGAPFINNLSTKAIALASSLNIVPVMNLTYNEGGNTLIGKKGDKPYALIGKDSYFVSKLLMENDLGRHVAHHEVVMAFAIDYGMHMDNIHFIEHPGDFHLDMSMAIVGNTILLNDAEAAQNLFAEEQQKRLAEQIEQDPDLEIDYRLFHEQEVLESGVRKNVEDATERDLRELGFNVVRVPGRFHYNSREPAMNFFNMVTAETPNGDNIVVMLGCVGDYAKIFEQTLRRYSDREIDQVYFLDLKSSQECLEKGGGISCRTKTIPLVREKPLGEE